MVENRTETSKNARKTWTDTFVDQALASLPKDASVQQKAAAMRGLVTQLQRLKEFERCDPRTMESILQKTNYRQVGVNYLGGGDNCLLVLPDERVVSGGAGCNVQVWSEGGDGSWTCESLQGHEREVSCLQRLLDGRIVSASADSTI